MGDIFNLSGRVAIVTGGSRGIGKMIATEFVKRGVKVYITARKAEPCIATAEEFVTTVSEPGPPNEYANLVTSHEELKTLVNLVYADTVELLAGLESSDTGEQRAAALDSFNSNLDQFIKKIEEVVASATSS